MVCLALLASADLEESFGGVFPRHVHSKARLVLELEGVLSRCRTNVVACCLLRGDKWLERLWSLWTLSALVGPWHHILQLVGLGGQAVEWQLVEQLLPLEWLAVVLAMALVVHQALFLEGGADVCAVSVQETTGEVDHCPPLMFYLDSISEVHDSSLTSPRHTFWTSCEVWKDSISCRFKRHSSFFRSPTGSFSWSAQGVTQLPATVSGDCEVLLGDKWNKPELCQPERSWQLFLSRVAKDIFIS